MLVQGERQLQPQLLRRHLGSHERLAEGFIQGRRHAHTSYVIN